jgi:predicted DNA-binding transcriptional regulator AlpA
MPSKMEEIDRPLLTSDRALKPSSQVQPYRERLFTPREAALFLRVSESWAAKARMRGDGPPYVKIGRSIRYPEAALLQWMKAHLHLSTSEPQRHSHKSCDQK